MWLPLLATSREAFSSRLQREVELIMVGDPGGIPGLPGHRPDLHGADPGDQEFSPPGFGEENLREIV